MPPYPLHDALLRLDAAAAADALAALADDELAATQRNRKGVTPLMLAAQGARRKGIEALARRLMHAGGGAAACLRSPKRHTAADYAERNGSGRLAAELRELEALERLACGGGRCARCGDVLPAQTALGWVVHRARQGNERNPLLARWCQTAEPDALLAQPAFHLIAGLHSVRQELSESLAAIGALRDAVPGFGDGWHALDLCCGKGVTSALLHLRHGDGVRVTAVDRREPKRVPHFDDACGGSVRFEQIDVLAGAGALAAALEAPGRPTAVIGIHLCGILSVRAVEHFARSPRARALVLAPCCLPPRHDPEAPPEVYAAPPESSTESRYAAWGEYLASLVRRLAPGATVTARTHPDMLSARAFLIVAVKEGEREAGQDAGAGRPGDGAGDAA